ncbi:MAG: DUF4382 domain-containing protein [Gammaproteobacteria bacterium]|nr:DUF4382 domain-containing protein [Gammaproteobacteria bacterium]
MKQTLLTLSILSSLAIAGCSGGPSSSDFSGRGGVPSGMLTLSITDAAIDDATNVFIQFSSIELKPVDGPSIAYDFDSPMQIDLLSLQGSLSQDFFNNIIVPSGDYEWLRLAVNTVADMDSYIRLNDGSVHELIIPSGSETGLKINNGFTVGAGSSVAMTIDFDLRQSIVVVADNAPYLLKPVLRLVNNAEAGSINGTIDSALTLAENCSDGISETGNAVYVFTGFDAELDDVDHQEPNPFTTALMTFNTDTGFYDYEVGFIPVGDYTVAYTCMADLDDPETNDLIEFQSATNVSVTAAVSLSGADINR